MILKSMVFVMLCKGLVGEELGPQRCGTQKPRKKLKPLFRLAPGGMVRTAPVLGSGSSSGEVAFLCFSTV